MGGNVQQRVIVQDIAALAPGLTRDADGIWHARRASDIHYPDEANEFCFGVEEGSFWFRHRNAVIADAVRRFPPSGFIADIGAGNGFVSLGLRQAGFETVVIEPGAAGIRNARARALSPLVHASLRDAGFLPRTLPAAGLFDVLEHIEDDRAMLALLHTLLIPGGRLYLTVPSFNVLWSSEDELTGHHRRYTVGSLSHRLREAGFAIDYSTYFFAPLPPPILLFRSLPTRLGFRRTLNAVQTASELRMPDNVATRILTRILASERRWIQRGRRVAIGSSCLVVARSAS